MANRRYQLNKNKYLLEPEVQDLESNLADEVLGCDRDALLISLALRTGARATELLNISDGDLNSYDRSVFIRGIKGSKDRELPLERAFFLRLDEYAQTRKQARTHTRNPTRNQTRDQSPNGAPQIADPRFEKNAFALFPIGYYRLRQIWDWYRPVPKKFHALRHTFAIRLYHKTKDIRLVQFALGHTNIANTMIYADYAYNQSELRKLIL